LIDFQECLKKGLIKKTIPSKEQALLSLEKAYFIFSYNCLNDNYKRSKKMKLELKSIGYWSLIKLSFILNLIIGFIMGLFFAIFTGTLISIMEQFGGFAGMGMIESDMPPIGFLLIFYPFLFSFGAAFFNTILYLIIAFVYNIIAKLIGGLEFEFGEVRPALVSYGPAPGYKQPPSAPSERSTPPPPPPPVLGAPAVDGGVLLNDVPYPPPPAPGSPP